MRAQELAGVIAARDRDGIEAEGLDMAADFGHAFVGKIPGIDIHRAVIHRRGVCYDNLRTLPAVKASCSPVSKSRHGNCSSLPDSLRQRCSLWRSASAPARRCSALINAVLLRPLPFRDPDRLVWIENVGTGGLSARTTRADTFNAWREQNTSFEALAGYFAFFDFGRRQTLTGGGEPERLRASASRTTSSTCSA